MVASVWLFPLVIPMVDRVQQLTTPAQHRETASVSYGSLTQEKIKIQNVKFSFYWMYYHFCTIHNEVKKMLSWTIVSWRLSVHNIIYHICCIIIYMILFSLTWKFISVKSQRKVLVIRQVLQSQIVKWGITGNFGGRIMLSIWNVRGKRPHPSFHLSLSTPGTLLSVNHD